MRIVLHIERVVLNDLPLPAGTERIVAQSLRQELAHRLSREGLPGAATADSAPGPTVTRTSGPLPAHAAALGRQVGEATYRGLGRAGEKR